MRAHSCIDIDECEKFPGLCRGNVHCTNTVGTYTCGCRYGFEKVESGCIDIDECTIPGLCPAEASCQNLGPFLLRVKFERNHFFAFYDMNLDMSLILTFLD